MWHFCSNTPTWHPFRGFFLVIAGALSLSLWAFPAAAETIFVVARQDAPVAALSQTEVAALFLGKHHSSNSLTLIDQRDELLREHFYRAVANMSLSNVRAFWAKRVFTGRGRPPLQFTEEEAMRALADNPAAITYIPSNLKPVGSKVLLTIEMVEIP